MSTEAQRRARSAYLARRKADGWVRLDVLISPDTASRLNRAAAVYGSMEAAITAALHALPQRNSQK